MPKILVADDQPLFLKVIDSLLTKQGYEVVTASSGQEALDLIEKTTFDVVLSDLQMEPISGMDLLKRIGEANKNLCVIMLTACEKVEVAIEAMKLGAFDYLTKPIQVNDLTQTVQRALEYSSSINSRQGKVLLEYDEQKEKLEGVTAHSSQMLRVCDLIDRIAPTETPVMISGESGSGTELAARNIHRCSTRADMPFVKIDCAAIYPDLLEKKFFGDAETQQENLFDASLGGTLFIREVGKMSLNTQDRLLDALKQRAMLKKEDRSIPDARVLSSTSEDLEKRVAAGDFREALYRQLRTFFIEIPPLREHQEDITPLIARTISQQIDPQNEMPMLTREAEELLKNYRWPGNVNELISAVQYAMAHLENNTITRNSLPPDLAEEAALTCEVLKEIKPAESLKGISLKAFLYDEEKGPLKRALDKVRSAGKTAEPDPQKPARDTGTAAARDDSAPFEWI